MSPLYSRQMEAARRDVVELCEMLLNPDLTITELALAIGLATMAHDALLRAAQAQGEKGADGK